MFWQSLCLSRLNMSVPSQAEDVWKHAERSEGMLSHIKANRRISYSETAAHARSCGRKKFQCLSFKYDSIFFDLSFTGT